MKRTSYTTVIFFSVMLFSFFGSQVAPNADEMTPAPQFTLADLDGNNVSLSDFAGNVVVLNFWATWCPACRMEIPHMIELQNKYQGEGVKIVGVSLDQGGAKVVKPFYDKNKLNYLMLIGTEQVVKDFGGIYGIPTTFIIDQKGTISIKISGVQGVKKLENEIEKLL